MSYDIQIANGVQQLSFARDYIASRFSWPLRLLWLPVSFQA